MQNKSKNKTGNTRNHPGGYASPGCILSTPALAAGYYVSGFRRPGKQIEPSTPVSFGAEQYRLVIECLRKIDFFSLHRARSCAAGNDQEGIRWYPAG